MEKEVSPKYQMRLVKSVEQAIWDTYESYKNAKFYIDKWHEEDYQNDWENFERRFKESSRNIDLSATLHGINGELLLKIAIDMGVETPDFIPSIPTFKNELKENYSTAFSAFQKSFKQIEEHPDIAIGLANSTLESIIKEILKDENTNTVYDKKKTLYNLTEDILKEFHLFPSSDMPVEIRNIGSSLLKLNQNIEKLRSDKTQSHGKTSGDYLITEPMYAYFVINSISTVGLFLTSFYKEKFSKLIGINDDDPDDLPF